MGERVRDETRVALGPERREDLPAVRALNERAFGQSIEGAIVDAIRARCPGALSIVAVEVGLVVGHILFSPVSVGETGGILGMGLGPMAVSPERQRRGIGSLLVRAGIEAVRERHHPFIVVLGHPEYYLRFGFVPASRYGLGCPWHEVPDDAFMVRVLDEAVMAGVSGIVRYREEFDQAV